MGFFPRPAAFFAMGLMLFAFILPAGLAAQTPADQTVYTIGNVEYRVEGITLHFALRNAADIVEGTRLVGKAALDRYIADKTQLLINQRVLESARIEALPGMPDATGTIAVDLTVYVSDTWNVIVLPYGRFDSNDGLELTLKARDYNFLGTMEALRLDLGYEIGSEALESSDWGKGSFIAEIDSNLPFSMFGLDWNGDFDHTLSYGSSYGFAYENKTGLSVAFPIAGTKLTVGAFQGVSVNEENGDDFKAQYGDRYEDSWYLSNWLEAAWSIPTGLSVPLLGDVLYIPRAEIRNKYRPGIDIGDERRGPTMTVGHELSLARVDWIGNFRRGMKADLYNHYEYNLDSAEWDRDLGGSVSAYLPISSWFGLSAKLAGDIYFDAPNDKAGSALRGILDRSVVSARSLFLNADLTLRAIRFVPSQWLNTRALRFFDFEQQWTPYVDMGMVSDPENDRAFGFDDALVAGGIEIVTFPLFMRSLYIRVSVGFDLRAAWATGKVPEGDGREFFVGLGHHY